MNSDQLKAILESHADWRAGREGGEPANLSGANLSWADLSGADLSGADLSGADLRWGNLSEANLSGADGVFDAAAWIADNLRRTRGGVFAYKTFANHYPPPDSWRQEPGAEIHENVNPLPTIDCGCGVNVGTLEWCREHGGSGPIWQLLIKWEWLAAGVIPYRTDGKFRVPRVRLIEVVES